MRINEYKAPKAEVTLFECEDVITKSLANSLSSKDNPVYSDSTKYVGIGKSASWSDIKNSNN